MRIVKKYSNRRLYDTEASAYVNLDELSALVRGGEEVKVVDAKTGDDLTRAVLLQVLLEQEGGAALFPTGLLHRMIRFGGTAPFHKALLGQLGTGMELLDAQLSQLERQEARLAEPDAEPHQPPGVPGGGAQVVAPLAQPLDADEDPLRGQSLQEQLQRPPRLAAGAEQVARDDLLELSGERRERMRRRLGLNRPGRVRGRLELRVEQVRALRLEVVEQQVGSAQVAGEARPQEADQVFGPDGEAVAREAQDQPLQQRSLVPARGGAQVAPRELLEVERERLELPHGQKGSLRQGSERVVGAARGVGSQLELDDEALGLGVEQVEQRVGSAQVACSRAEEVAQVVVPPERLSEASPGPRLQLHQGLQRRRPPVQELLQARRPRAGSRPRELRSLSLRPRPLEAPQRGESAGEGEQREAREGRGRRRGERRLRGRAGGLGEVAQFGPISARKARSSLRSSASVGAAARKARRISWR